MRVLVISDSHGRRSTLEDVVDICQKENAPETIIHLGDHFSDARYLKDRVKQRIIAVPGNCDWGHSEPEEIIQRVAGVPFLICHGHTLHVKRTLLPIVCRARETGVRAALFGHTHAPLMEYEEGILLVNPGALQDERCAVLDIENGEISGKLMNLNDLC